MISTLHQDIIDGLRARLDASHDIAAASGEILRHYFAAHTYTIEDKADGSPVTTADREAEACIRRAIDVAFPDDDILGEEEGGRENDSSSGYRWVIDPIDGTIAFVHGVPLFGILIGIEYEEHSFAGMMDFPIIGERAWAIRGHGAWHQYSNHDPVQAQVSDRSRLDRAMVCTTSYDYFRDHGYGDAYVALAQRARRTRGWSDCYCELLLCTGRVDAVVEPELKRWDIAAIIPILVEAGGRYTDWSGRRENDAGATRGVATNGFLHQELIDLLQPWA